MNFFDLVFFHVASFHVLYLNGCIHMSTCPIKLMSLLQSQIFSLIPGIQPRDFWHSLTLTSALYHLDQGSGRRDKYQWHMTHDTCYLSSLKANDEYHNRWQILVFLWRQSKLSTWSETYFSRTESYFKFKVKQLKVSDRDDKWWPSRPDWPRGDSHIFNRPVVAGAVLHTPLSLTDWLII